MALLTLDSQPFLCLLTIANTLQNIIVLLTCTPITLDSQPFSMSVENSKIIFYIWLC